jgi:hypothetical protein
MRKWLRILNMRIMYASKANIPYVGVFFRACSLRNIWKNSIESVHPFTSEQLDAQNLILAGILMTNVKELFKVWN